MVIMTSYPEYVNVAHDDIGDVDINDLITAASEYGEFFYDLETTGLDPRKDSIDGIAFYVPPSPRNNEIRAWYPFVNDTAILTIFICESCPWQSYSEDDCCRVDIGSMDRYICPDCDSNLRLESVSLRPSMDHDDTFDALKPLFLDESIVNWAYHRKFDDGFIEQQTPINNIKNKRADPMLMVFLVDENPRQFGLKQTTDRWFGHKMVSFKEAKKSRQGRFAFDFKTPLCIYAMDDCYWTWRVRDKAQKELEYQDPSGRLERIFWGIDMPISRIIQEMETTGFLIDWEHLARLDDHLANQQDIIYKREIEDLTSDWVKDINLSSRIDKSMFIFGAIESGGLELPTTNLIPDASGIYPTNKDNIQHLAVQASVVSDVLEWSSIATLRSGFTGKIRDLARESPTGRIYFRLNQTGTVIGRMSSSTPVNGQNQPSARDMYGIPGVRHAYCSELEFTGHEDERLLFGADFSQIELRVAAHLAQEPVMLQVYKSDVCIEEDGDPCIRYRQGHECTDCDWSGNVPKGSVCPKCGHLLEWQARCRHMDLHQRTAEDVGVPRGLAKALNFGNLYRQGPKRFCDTAGLFDKKGIRRVNYARKIQDGWMNLYCGIPRYHEHVEKELMSNGWISYTITGRRRRLKEMASHPDRRYRAVTQGIQYAISGSAQDIMKTAMIKIWRHIRRMISKSSKAISKKWMMVKMLLQIHDEIILEGPRCLENEIKEMIKREMEGVVNPRGFSVPLVVDAKSGRTWRDIH